MELDNNLYYPDQAMTINAFRGYFRLQGIEAGDLPINAIELNFNDETTGLSPIHSLNSEGSSLRWRWTGEPMAPEFFDEFEVDAAYFDD